MFLSLVDLTGRPVEPDADALTVRTICTNRDLPSRLPFGNEAGDFELESAVPVKRIVSLIKPSDTLRPPVGKDSLWRLVSQLSLNYLSLVGEGREAFQELLRLYNFTGSTYSEKHIEGLTALDSSRHFARVVTDDGVTFARGMQVEMEFDEEQFTGAGVYLFAAVIEQFLGMYVSMNSFSQLRVRTPSAKGGSPPMAAASGQENFDVVRWPIADTLDREPYRFEFFQAVRLLQRMYPRRGVAGRFNNPGDEVARFGSRCVGRLSRQRDSIARSRHRARPYARELHGPHGSAGHAPTAL